MLEPKTKLLGRGEGIESRPTNVMSNINNIKPTFLIYNPPNCKLSSIDKSNACNYNQRQRHSQQKQHHPFTREKYNVTGTHNYTLNGENHGKNRNLHKKHKSKQTVYGCSGKEVMGLAWYFASATGNIIGSIGKQIGKDVINTIFNPDPTYNSIRSYYYYQDYPNYHRQPQHMITQRIDYDEMLKQSNMNMMYGNYNQNNLSDIANMNGLMNLASLFGDNPPFGQTSGLGNMDNLDNIGNMGQMTANDGINPLIFNRSSATNRTGPPDFF
ncbi:hypothetical protein BMR1_02g03360 [Babesia microti strain RI]|uniref:Uncharacterized protein n=1 Tax=Babesia microti (strain RI) TaxID=1133968 RepID=I7IQJ1_BABMR|nr:hypothetical protein BMR1_02g03360 [Babesia microti strain RI]CCF73825.1 hypothetical protein BMR1_02g03360 [Babesia microti strain RI]|eukprot:XP_012648434.1 hypothetical protein BMR1_02g03360 [Babesia microti strain RI]